MLYSHSSEYNLCWLYSPVLALDYSFIVFKQFSFFWNVRGVGGEILSVQPDEGPITLYSPSPSKATLAYLRGHTNRQGTTHGRLSFRKR
jgi:hypothetical protein